MTVMHNRLLPVTVVLFSSLKHEMVYMTTIYYALAQCAAGSQAVNSIVYTEHMYTEDSCGCPTIWDGFAVVRNR